MEAACSRVWPPEKVSPPEWHLDCDRSDPETVSSPVLSKGPEKVHRYRYQGQYGDRQG